MKKLISIILAALLMISVTGCGKEYRLIWPENSSITHITLEKAGEVITIEKRENIDAISLLIKGEGRITKSESNPQIVEQGEGIMISVFSGDTISKFFVVSDNEKYIIDQSEIGSFEITEAEFNDIKEFYTGIKQPIDDFTMTSFTSAIKKLSPLDEIGHSFKPANLSNRELLRYGFLQFNPKGNGFIDISFEILNRTYIKGSFGIETAAPEDIVCSCGQVIANYNSSNDTYTWDKSFHYTDHKAEAFNEIKAAYTVEDKYYIELYKIFPDLMMNSSTQQYNFYPSYNDAARQTNPIFTVTNRDEFSDMVNTIDNTGRPVYRLIFTVKGTPKLVNYEIIE